MEDFKKWFSLIPWLGFGVSLVLGIWWKQLTGKRANQTLLFVVLFLSIGVFFLPWVTYQPWYLRLLWTSGAVLVSGLIAYSLWARYLPLDIRASTSAAEYRSKPIIGGIEWKSAYSEIRVLLNNCSDVDFKEIDLVLQTDQALTLAGQVTRIAGVSLSFNDPPLILPEWVNPATGEREAIPLVAIASTNGYRLRCELLPRRSHLEIVLAAVTLNDGPAQCPSDALLCISLSDGSKFWLGSKDFTEGVFGPKPTTSFIRMNGEYKTSDREIKISSEIPVVDWIASLEFTGLAVDDV